MRWWRISSPLGRQEDFDLPSLELKSTLASTGKTLYLDSGNLFEPRPQELQRLSLQRRGHGRHVVQLSDAGIPAISMAVHAGSTSLLATNVNETPLALALGSAA